MSASIDLLSDFKSLLNQLDITDSDARFKLSSFAEQGTNKQALSNALQTLLNEGDIHQSASWAAHMTSPISLDSLLGQLLSGLHNGNLMSPRLYPVLAEIEQQTLSWLCQLFEQNHGHFVPGGSYGNLEALWQAKQQSAENRLVYASKAAHYSIAKACQILDLKLIYIDSNDDDQIDIENLIAHCKTQPPLAIVANAGTSSTGHFDSLADCIDIAKQYNAWSHVDAAWGGAYKLLAEVDSLFKGIQEADSVVFDPHKVWAQPKPCSVVFYQKALVPFLSADSHYLEQNPNTSLPGSYGGENFLPLWLFLHYSGIDKLRQNLRGNLQQAQLFASLLKQLSNWPVFSSPSGIICFETTNNGLTDLLEHGIFSQSKRADKPVYRVVFNNNTKAEALIAEIQPYF